MKRHLIPILILTVLTVAAGAAAADAASSVGVVNVNTATAGQLEMLPRIGPALAQRILDFREANGPFRSVDELVAVKGIGDRSLELLAPYLTVKGETTLSEKVRTSRRSGDVQGQ